jgi:light-harvesting protein B-800-850 alpha chain
MNNGRIWCVVNPTVGLPLFLGSVAVISFTVHFAVLSNSTWVKDFFQGSRAKKAAIETAPAQFASSSSQAGFNVSVAPAAESGAFVVTISPTTGGGTKTLAWAQGIDASPSKLK